MYKKKLHREEQKQKRIIYQYFEKNYKSTKIFTSNKIVDARMVFYIIEQQIDFFLMKNLSSKIVDYNNGKEMECAFEF